MRMKTSMHTGLSVRPGLLALVIASALFFVCAPVGAMQFSHDKTGLRFEGQINPGDYDRMIAFFRSTPRAFVAGQLIHLNSPGGSVAEALRIARFIRDTSRSTLVGGSARCYSACFFLLIAGGYREIDASATLGIHRPYYSPKEYAAMTPSQARQAYEKLDVIVRHFLDEMRISPGVVKLMFATPSTSIKVLDKATFARNIGTTQPWWEELERAACQRPNVRQSMECMIFLSAKERVDQLPRYLGAESARSEHAWLVDYKRWADASLVAPVAAVPSAPLSPAEVVAEVHPGWEALVNTSDFKHWLDSQPPEIQRLAASEVPADAIQLLDRYKRRSMTVDTLRLSCDLRMSDQGKTPNHLDVVVDLERETVGGHPATISSDTIRSRTALSDGDSMTISISRSSGAIQMFSSRLGSVATGKCERSSKRRF